MMLDEILQSLCPVFESELIRITATMSLSYGVGGATTALGVVGLCELQSRCLEMGKS